MIEFQNGRSYVLKVDGTENGRFLKATYFRHWKFQFGTTYFKISVPFSIGPFSFIPTEDRKFRSSTLMNCLFSTTIVHLRFDPLISLLSSVFRSLKSLEPEVLQERLALKLVKDKRIRDRYRGVSVKSRDPRTRAGR